MGVARFWCEYAWLGDETAERDVIIEVTDGLISSVTVGASQSADATVLSGIVLPGLANAHSHAFHRALRGRTQIGAGSFWTWREQMYAAASRLQPDSYHRLARGVFGEMAMAGITCVGEFHYLHHDASGSRYADPNAMGVALAIAAAEAGIRLTLLDTCYLHGGLDASGQRLDPSPVQQRFSDGSVDRWAERVAAGVSFAAPHVRIGAAAHSVRAVDPAAIGVIAAFATERAMPLHTHLSEQPGENAQCRAAYGLTPTEVFAEAGALSTAFTAVHATHLTAGDIGLLGGAQCTCCFCPTTERDLADGIGPARQLLTAGAALSLGSDSHAVIDLLEEARAVELDERLATNERGGHSAAALLRAATIDGHRSLGWSDAGALEVGRRADLVAIRLDSVRTAGHDDTSVLETAVFAATAADVSTVVRDGEVVVRDGQHVRIDAAAELATAIRELMR